MRDQDEEVWHPVPSGEAPAAPFVREPPPGRPAPLAINWFGANEELRRGRERFDARRVAHWMGGAAMGFLWLVLVGNAVLTAVLFLEGEALPEIDTAALVVGLGFNVLLFVGAPLAWVAAFYRGGASAYRDRLQLRSFALGRDLGFGVGLGFVALGVSWAIVLVTTQFTELPTDNPVVETLAAGLTWPLVVFIAVASSVSEEVLFRGLVQPRIGVVGASVLFGVIHLSYGTPLQIAIPLVLGFLFGWVVLRKRSLVPAIVAHFTFNFVQLVLAKLYADGVFDLAVF